MKRFLHYFTFASIITFPAATAYGGQPEQSYSPRIVKVRTEAEADSLKESGVEILRRRGDILLCFFPEAPTRSGEAPLVPRRTIAPALDASKTFFDAYTVQNGQAAGTPYTGKGVVVGLCDIGIDPLHPTFLDAAGHSRIKRVVQYVESDGLRLQLEGDDAYRRWKTDDPDMYHATHVCGILAGGGAGTPYVGIAPDAEIVATVSTLTEVGLLAGVEDIIEYAREQGKPAVINISVGSYTGPHDGSTLFSQYLDMCAEDAVIVLSSGNEGSHLNYLGSTFTVAQSEIPVRIGNTAWDNYRMYGMTDIWSSSASPLTVSIGAYDADSRQMAGWLEPISINGGETFSYVWDSAPSGDGEWPFEGELTAQGGVDPENGRYKISLGYEFMSPEPASGGPWARYELAVKVGGRPGEDVEIYADGTYSRLVKAPGGPTPTADRSISDLACGFNVVSVGMYGNRDSVPQSHPEAFGDDGIYWESTGYRSGQTVVHSSYGTLRDGRMTPLTVAPGASLVSAGSRIFHESYPFHPHVRIDGTPWFDESGTSMASPYVAGYIATWLEAVPELTSADVRRIIAESNRMDIAEPDDPHNANGYFDPVRGLKLALQTGGVESVGDSALSPDEYVEAFDIAGVRRYAGPASGLSGIAKGLYVVMASGKTYKKMID